MEQREGRYLRGPPSAFHLLICYNCSRFRAPANPRWWHACSRRVVECQQCKGGFEACDVVTHMNTVCPARKMVCRFGCPDIPLVDLVEHEAGTNNFSFFCVTTTVTTFVNLTTFTTVTTFINFTIITVFVIVLMYFQLCFN